MDGELETSPSFAGEGVAEPLVLFSRNIPSSEYLDGSAKTSPTSDQCSGTRCMHTLPRIAYVPIVE